MSLTYLYVIITSALSVVVTFGSLKRVQCRTKNRQKVTFFRIGIYLKGTTRDGSFPKEKKQIALESALSSTIS